MGSIESILKGKNAKECAMSPPKETGVWNNILFELGNIYAKSPVKAFKEYVSNAYDANASNIEIKIQRRGRYKKITISDDGEGMFLYDSDKKMLDKDMSELGDVVIKDDSILALPKKVGDSAKKHDSRSMGEKAIGALAWQSLGNRVMFISKKKGHLPVGWACSHTETENKDHVYDSQVIPQFSKDDAQKYFPSTRSGTVVTFEDLSDGALNKLKGVSLKRDLGSEFRDLIKENNVRIRIKDGTNSYDVEPEEYIGDKITKKNGEIPSVIQTKYGDIRLELYANPIKKDSRGVVRLKHKITTLIDDLGDKQYLLGTSAWGSGILYGQIRADWLPPAAGRSEFVETNPKVKVFCEALKQYNGALEKIVNEFKEGSDEDQQDLMYKDFMKGWKLLLKEYPEYGEIIQPGYKTSQTGVVKDGAKEESDVVPPEMPPETERTDSHGGDREGGKILDPTKKGDQKKARPSPILKFNDCSEDFSPNELSRYVKEYNTIEFNNQHPAYITAMRKKEKKKQFLTGLAGKEILSLKYEGTELTDQTLVFQQRFAEFLNL